MVLAARRDSGVEHRHVVLEDLRARRRRHALRRDHVLDRDRDPISAEVVADVQVRVQLGVALTDRVEVGAEQLGAGDLLRLEELLRPLGGEPERVDHAGGTLK
jgi:hypothetical protein